ncbi:MAG: hypothetical protein HW421_801 [Ignavibacteria bacterium]|nr:hypothetical protein [Ignavibacteria bacterium]
MRLSKKEKIDIMHNLQKFSFDSFKERRQYQWKISISLWTILILLIYALMKEEIKTDLQSFPLILFLVLYTI